MTSPNPVLGFRQVLSIAPVRRLWLAQLVSIMGDFLAIFAVFSVATFRFHASATAIALIMVAFMLPLGVVSPLSGVLVDRWDRKRTMIASDLIRASLVLILVFATDLRAIYATLFALSVVSSFFMPAQSVTLRGLVPREGLMAANALMAQAFQVVQIFSPAIAGALVGWMGPNICFYLDSASFLFSAAMVSRIAFPRTTSPRGQALGSVTSELLSGLKFIFTHSAVSYVMIAMTMGTFAIRCFGALLAVYVRDVLVAGSVLFGALSSMIGIGMILGTQVVHRFSGRRRRDSLVNFGLLTAGIFIVVAAAVRSGIATAIGMMGVGFGVAFVFVPAQTLLQEVTPHDMLGRVSSSLMSCLALTQVSALLLSGSLAELIGIRNLYFASAVMLALIASFGQRRITRRRAAA